jgi:hypothetical protein
VVQCVLQARKESSSVDALWLVSDCTLANNTVFHALLLSVGNRTSWREYITRKADVLDAGVAGNTSGNAELHAKALPLENHAASWWVTRCTVHGNKLVMQNAAAGGAGSSARRAAGAKLSQKEVAARNSSSSSWDAWTQAGPDSTYEEAVSVVMTADADLQRKLALGGKQCAAALAEAYEKMQIGLQLRRATHARLPSIIWTTTNQGYLSATEFANNTGFSHVLRHDNTLVTWLDVTLRSNTVQKSLVDLWYGDFMAKQARLTGNAAQNGSIFDLESFIGSFDQVSLLVCCCFPALLDDTCSSHRQLARAGSVKVDMGVRTG